MKSNNYYLTLKKKKVPKTDIQHISNKTMLSNLPVLCLRNSKDRTPINSTTLTSSVNPLNTSKPNKSNIQITEIPDSRKPLKTYKYPPHRRDLFITKPNETSTNQNSSKQIKSKIVLKKNIKKVKPLMETTTFEKRRLIFNKLYGITPEYEESCRKMKENKDSVSLEEYQEKMLTIYGNRDTVNREYYNELTQKFRDIRDETHQIEPLPPINFEIIQQHSMRKKKQDGDKKKKRVSLKQLIFDKSTEDKDEFEIEMQQIELGKRKYISKKHRVINKNMLLLPPHIVDSIAKKMKFSL